MSELQFESKFTTEEIEQCFDGADVFSGIMNGLEEALAFEQGQAAADTFARKRSLPDVKCG